MTHAPNNRTEDPADREFARRRFFAVLGEQCPMAKSNRDFRLAFLNAALRPAKPITSCATWTERHYAYAADRIAALADLSDAAYLVLPVETPAAAPDADALEQTEAELAEWATLSVRMCWAGADRLAAAVAQAQTAGERPRVALTRFAKAARLKYATAARWVACSRLVLEGTRLEFPELSFSVFERAVSAPPPPGEARTWESVREWLILASDNQLSGPGLVARMMGGTPDPQAPHPADAAFTALCALVSPGTATELRDERAVIEAALTLRRRKVAP